MGHDHDWVERGYIENMPAESTGIVRPVNMETVFNQVSFVRRGEQTLAVLSTKGQGGDMAEEFDYPALKRRQKAALEGGKITPATDLALRLWDKGDTEPGVIHEVPASRTDVPVPR